MQAVKKYLHQGMTYFEACLREAAHGDRAMSDKDYEVCCALLEEIGGMRFVRESAEAVSGRRCVLCLFACLLVLCIVL